MSGSEVTFTIDEGEVAAFARASGDVNPWHVDPSFASRTSSGRPVVHGALLVLATLARLSPHADLRRIGVLDVTFRQPVEPGLALTLRQEHDAYWFGAQLSARGIDVVDLAGVLARPPVEDPRAPDLPAEAPGDGVLAWPFEQLLQEGAAVDAPYAPSRELEAVRSRPGKVPLRIAWWLAAASWAIGTRVPGQDALLVALRLEVDGGVGGGNRVSLRTAELDRRVGALTLEGSISTPYGGCRVVCETFVRRPAPRPRRRPVAYETLRDAKVVVVGGSRGIGAATAAALADRGATVWVGFNRNRLEAAELASAYPSGRVRPFGIDATSAVSTAEALAAVTREAEVVNGLVLSATPPLFEARLTPAAADDVVAFAQASIAMALRPLAATAAVLAEDSWIVFLSSTATEELPEAWPHYVTAKGAIEALAAYAAETFGARVLVARPPRTWTDLTNTPLAPLASVSPADVAEAIAGWTERPAPAGTLDVLPAAAMLGKSAVGGATTG